MWHKAPVSTWQEAQKIEFTVGSSGVNSTPSFYGRLLNETLGLKQKIIVGYQSQTHAFLAMERGEVDGYPSVFYNSLMATRPNWLKDKMVKLLVQMGLEKEPNIPDVPFALDLLSNPDDKLLSIAAYAPLQAGRPYLMPPGVPADRVAAMQKAMMDTFKDPAFIAEANKRGMDVSSPRSGEELRDLLQRVYTKTPDAHRPAAAEDFDALSSGIRHATAFGADWRLPMIRTEGVLHFTIPVKDLDRSEKFYTEILGHGENPSYRPHGVSARRWPGQFRAHLFGKADRSQSRRQARDPQRVPSERGGI